MNPYSVLGLGKDATPEEVHQAFRDKAKTAHPDTGGDEEAFKTLTNAHLVLKDPARRKRFDETGEADETADNPDIAAWNIVGGMIQAILAEDKDAATIDLVDAMKQQLMVIIGKVDSVIAKMDRAAKRATKLKTRFHRKSKGDNMLSRMTEHQLIELERSKAKALQQSAPHRRALELISDYRFDVEKMPEQGLTVGMMNEMAKLMRYEINDYVNPSGRMGR